MSPETGKTNKIKKFLQRDRGSFFTSLLSTAITVVLAAL